MPDYDVSIVIPCLNEEKTLGRALEMARGLATDPALKQSAEAAAAAIEKLLAAPARVIASKNPEKAGNAVDKDPSTRSRGSQG